MSAERFYQLIAQYQSDELNTADWKEFSSILETGAYKTWIDADIKETFDKMEAHALWNDNLKQDVWNQVKDKTILLDAPSVAPVHRIHFLRRGWLKYAAAVILIAGAAATWWEISRPSRNKGTVAVSKNQDIQPGGNKAVLTIGNSQIALAGNKTGINVGNTITYNDGEHIADASQLLQLTTPKGGQYQAVLPDGSKVWLNAASSIRFPSKFAGDKREVEIEGEVYLEIAKNSRQPFYVTTPKTTVQVLGTSFNINAYEDEELEKTTLIEGSLRVVATPHREEREISSDQTILQPNEQAVVGGSGSKINKIRINVQNEIAWKNGLFNFEGSDLKSVMRQLERWYDIKVQYQGSVPATTFSGKIYRSVSFSDVLEVLQKMGVKLRMEGKTLIIF